MIKIYRKTATIKAEQFDGSDEMIERYDMGFQLAPNGKGGAIIKTLEGDLLVHVGDWIATGVNGEQWAIKNDVFKKTYAELPVIPENVACLIKQDKEWDYNLGMAFDDAFSGYIWKSGVGEWIIAHSDTFARAWLDGYQVEEDE